jgi:hypothetical protein
LGAFEDEGADGEFAEFAVGGKGRADAAGDGEESFGSDVADGDGGTEFGVECGGEEEAEREAAAEVEKRLDEHGAEIRASFAKIKWELRGGRRGD